MLELEHAPLGASPQQISESFDAIIASFGSFGNFLLQTEQEMYAVIHTPKSRDTALANLKAAAPYIDIAIDTCHAALQGILSQDTPAFTATTDFVRFLSEDRIGFIAEFLSAAETYDHEAQRNALVSAGALLVCTSEFQESIANRGVGVGVGNPGKDTTPLDACIFGGSPAKITDAVKSFTAFLSQHTRPVLEQIFEAWRYVEECFYGRSGTAAVTESLLTFQGILQHHRERVLFEVKLEGIGKAAATQKSLACISEAYCKRFENLEQMALELNQRLASRKVPATLFFERRRVLSMYQGTAAYEQHAEKLDANLREYNSNKENTNAKFGSFA